MPRPRSSPFQRLGMNGRYNARLRREWCHSPVRHGLFGTSVVGRACGASDLPPLTRAVSACASGGPGPPVVGICPVFRRSQRTIRNGRWSRGARGVGGARQCFGKDHSVGRQHVLTGARRILSRAHQSHWPNSTFLSLSDKAGSSFCGGVVEAERPVQKGRGHTGRWPRGQRPTPRPRS
jgi:hypothetical protein